LLATGRLPFVESTPLAYFVAHSSKSPEPPRALNPKVAPALEAAILKALSKKPEERFENAQAMRAALLAALEAPAEPAQPSEPPRTPTPQPSHPCHLASVPASVSWQGGGAARQLTTADLSRGGVFLCAEPPLPPLLTRVRIALQHPEGEIDCQGDVIRHVLPEQARAWSMEVGFAVQFVDLGEKARHDIERLLQGRPPSETKRLTSVGDDPAADRALEQYRKRVAGDHYALLGLAPDAEQSEVRSRARAAGRELEQMKQRPLSARQREQVDSLLERVSAAVAALGSPARRAEHDARTANFRGVARCLSAGLGVEELEELHKHFLAERPKSSTGAQLQLVTANAYLANGELQRALASLENALALDPLNLGIHQKYWALKRRAS
jgi:serine/threonine-protein kinase